MTTANHSLAKANWAQTPKNIISGRFNELKKQYRKHIPRAVVCAHVETYLHAHMPNASKAVGI